MRLHFTLAFLLFSVFGVFAQDVSKEAIAQAIDIKKLEHPYLFFNASEKQAIRQRIEADPESRQIMDRLLAEAKMLLYHPVDPGIPVRATHTRAGWTEEDNENAYERKLGRYRRNAETLAFVYQMTNDKQYAQKAFAFAEVVCRMPVWTLQAHEFSIIYSRVMPWNVPVAGKAEAEAIAQSVKLAAKPASTTVQFKYRKQDYTYDYSRGSDGLRLNE